MAWRDTIVSLLGYWQFAAVCYLYDHIGIMSTTQIASIRWANVGMMLAYWHDVGVGMLTLGQRWPNIGRPTKVGTFWGNVCQRWPNVGPTLAQRSLANTITNIGPTWAESGQARIEKPCSYQLKIVITTSNKTISLSFIC